MLMWLWGPIWIFLCRAQRPGSSCGRVGVLPDHHPAGRWPGGFGAFAHAPGFLSPFGLMVLVSALPGSVCYGRFQYGGSFEFREECNHMKMTFKIFTLFILLALLLMPASPAYAQGPNPDGGQVIFGSNFTAGKRRHL